MSGGGAGRPKRVRAWRHGRWAETVAAALLVVTGWRILARDWRSPAGEIDIVARRRRTIAFIEVKTRDDLAAAGEAIGQRQQQRIRRAAGLYLARHPALATLDARFDAVLVLPWRWPVFIRDAWRE
jgi:putative endonuclease